MDWQATLTRAKLMRLLKKDLAGQGKIVPKILYIAETPYYNEGLELEATG